MRYLYDEDGGEGLPGKLSDGPNRSHQGILIPRQPRVFLQAERSTVSEYRLIQNLQEIDPDEHEENGSIGFVTDAFALLLSQRHSLMSGIGLVPFPHLIVNGIWLGHDVYVWGNRGKKQLRADLYLRPPPRPATFDRGTITACGGHIFPRVPPRLRPSPPASCPITSIDEVSVWGSGLKSMTKVENWPIWCPADRLSSRPTCPASGFVGRVGGSLNRLGVGFAVRPGPMLPTEARGVVSTI